MQNTTLIINLNEYLNSKELYIKYTNDSENWYYLLDYPETLFMKYEYLNKCYGEKYEKNLLPILHKGDDNYICVYEGKYYLIHAGTDLGDEIEGQFSTSEEVWDKVIKPDIERYYEQNN